MNIKNGNSLNLLKDVKSDSVDCMVTDPPYGISFMNKDWDKAVPDVAIWKECIRVLKPGAFAFVMCSPRSDVQAEMVIKLKEAGFQLNYSPLYWCYLSGFPKAENIANAIDKRFRDQSIKALKMFVYDTVFKSLGIPPAVYDEILTSISIGETGYDKQIIGQKKLNHRDKKAYTPNTYDGINGTSTFKKNPDMNYITAPVSDEAKALNGAYTYNPKPAVEVIIVAMKPLSEKTYVDQALKNGKGITWLDDGRIPYEVSSDAATNPLFRLQNGYKINHGKDVNGTSYRLKHENGVMNINESGRFPANLLVQDNVLDNGIISKSGGVGGRSMHGRGEGYGFRPMGDASPELPSDEGSLSRYFSLDAWYSKNIDELPDYVQRIYPFLYVPKASNSERSEGLDIFEEQTVNDGRNKSIDNAFQRGETLRKNTHPTVKPLKLMTYLITIGSRPGDTILDPFMGSGTTGVAAKMLHRNFIGFEIEGKYFEIAKERIEKRAATRDIFEFDAMKEMEYEEK